MDSAYKDEFGEPFKFSGNWDKYELDEMLMLEIFKVVCWDDYAIKGRRLNL